MTLVEQPWLDFFNIKTASEPVFKAAVTDSYPVVSGNDPFKRETTLEVLVTHLPWNPSVYPKTLIPLSEEDVGVLLTYVGHWDA